MAKHYHFPQAKRKASVSSSCSMTATFRSTPSDLYQLHCCRHSEVQNLLEVDWKKEQNTLFSTDKVSEGDLPAYKGQLCKWLCIEARPVLQSVVKFEGVPSARTLIICMILHVNCTYGFILVFCNFHCRLCTYVLVCTVMCLCKFVWSKQYAPLIQTFIFSLA